MKREKENLMKINRRSGFTLVELLVVITVLGILAAKLVGRPVKLVVRREQLYGPFGHRSPTRQTLRLGASAEGQLSAIHHHARVVTSSRLGHTRCTTA